MKLFYFELLPIWLTIHCEHPLQNQQYDMACKFQLVGFLKPQYGFVNRIMEKLSFQIALLDDKRTMFPQLNL